MYLFCGIVMLSHDFRTIPGFGYVTILATLRYMHLVGRQKDLSVGTT